MPLAPAVIVSHAALDDAVHPHPAVAVTATLLLELPDATLTVVGDAPNVQATPAWVTVKVWPPTVIVAVRLSVVGFAATEKATVPEPVPVAPLVIVSQLWLLVAVLAQPVPVVTLKLPVLAPAATDALVGDSVTAHGSVN